MGTLFVGMLIVAASAVGFGLALFGRRPEPQPVTHGPGAHLGAAARDRIPQLRSLRTAVAGRLPAARSSSSSPRAADVTLSKWVRIRSALLLTLTVVGLATIIGGVLSVVLVGLVLFVT